MYQNKTKHPIFLTIWPVKDFIVADFSFNKKTISSLIKNFYKNASCLPVGKFVISPVGLMEAACILAPLSRS